MRSAVSDAEAEPGGDDPDELSGAGGTTNGEVGSEFDGSVAVF